jgi:hypothetical protein
MEYPITVPIIFIYLCIDDNPNVFKGFKIFISDGDQEGGQ